MSPRSDSPQQRKRPGRKPFGDQAMSGAEKMAAHRVRQKQRAYEAVVHPEDASRVTLLATITLCLTKLDTYKGRSEVVRENMRGGASRAIRELVTRYQLTI